jgi:hypothetical protein
MPTTSVPIISSTFATGFLILMMRVQGQIFFNASEEQEIKIKNQ